MRKIIQSLVIVCSLLATSAYAQDVTEVQQSIDGLSDVFAKDMAARWKWKGDIRVRNENIEQEFSLDRNRNRFRVRVGFDAEVNPTVKAGIQLASGENADSRSSNQSFTDVNSRKALDLDLAFAEWSPNPYAKITVGKMRPPLVMTTSYFVDKDVNPEGVAIAYNHTPTGVFVNGAILDLAERANAVDSTAVALQVGYRKKVNDDTSYVVAINQVNHRAVKNQAVIQSGSAGSFYGNTTKTTGCAPGVATCLANEFEVRNAMIEVATVFVEQPLVLFVDLAENTKAAKLNKAYAAGVTIGKASLPNSWEVGILAQKVEKDALYAQWIDSDYAAGNTDGDGYTIRGAYQIAKNWRFNFTYMMNDLNNDVPVSVTVNNVARPIYDRQYRRLQLDLNYSF